MEDNKKYWLNEFGLRRWQHKTLPYELQREYYWVDHVSILGNSINGSGRKYYGSCPFSILNELKIISHKYDLSFSLDDFEIIDLRYERKKKLKKIMK